MRELVCRKRSGSSHRLGPGSLGRSLSTRRPLHSQPVEGLELTSFLKSFWNSPQVSYTMAGRRGGRTKLVRRLQVAARYPGIGLLWVPRYLGIGKYTVPWFWGAFCAWVFGSVFTCAEVPLCSSGWNSQGVTLLLGCLGHSGTLLWVGYSGL